MHYRRLHLGINRVGSYAVYGALAVKMQCDREDALFIAVSEMARLVSPRNRKFSASSSLAAKWTERFLEKKQHTSGESTMRKPWIAWGDRDAMSEINYSHMLHTKVAQVLLMTGDVHVSTRTILSRLVRRIKGEEKAVNELLEGGIHLT